MSYRLFLGLCFLALAGIGLQAQRQGSDASGSATKQASATEISFIIRGPQALRESLLLLESQLDCTITCEDPQFKFIGALRESYAGSPVLVPQDRTVKFSYQKQDRNEPLKVIGALLNEYHRCDDTVRFEVTQSKANEKVFNVAPIAEKTAKGELVISASLLDTKVAIDTTDTYAGITREICKQVSKAAGERKVWLTGTRFGIFGQKKVAFKSKETTARSCLNALFDKFNITEKARLSWTLDVAPNMEFAFLNLHDVFSYEKEPGLVDVMVWARRPLADVAKVVEGEFQKAVYYEDPPYVASILLVKDSSGPPVLAFRGKFWMAYRQGSAIGPVLMEAVRVQNTRSSGKFVAQPMGQPMGGAFYVHPTEFMNENEKVMPLKPVLATKVALSANQQPVNEILKQLCAALAEKTGQKIKLGQQPPLPALNQVLTYDGKTRPAVEHLAGLSKLLADKVSWQLLYEPRENGYVLNAHLIEGK